MLPLPQRHKFPLFIFGTTFMYILTVWTFIVLLLILLVFLYLYILDPTDSKLEKKMFVWSSTGITG